MADFSAKEKRALRFEREHELERRRGMGLEPSSQSTPQAPTPSIHGNLTRKKRLQQSTSFGEGDTLDVTPDLVRLYTSLGKFS